MTFPKPFRNDQERGSSSSIASPNCVHVARQSQSHTIPVKYSSKVHVFRNEKHPLHPIPNDKEGLKHAKTSFVKDELQSPSGVTTFLLRYDAKLGETPKFLDSIGQIGEGQPNIAPDSRTSHTIQHHRNVIWKALPGLGHGTLSWQGQGCPLTADQKAKHSSLSPERSTGK